MLTRLLLPFRIKTLVYQFTGPTFHQEFDYCSEFRLIPACSLSVQRLFRDDTVRRGKFLLFLQSGCFGYFLERDGQWITYGWSTQPKSMHPPHLPRWVADLDAHWIFYCHTREEFRGQGHYRRLLARLVAGAYERAPDPLLLCDTLPDNLASRRAVLHAGFAPKGVLTTYQPLHGMIVGGRWRRDEEHTPGIEPEPGNTTARAA
jgi:RimJ/RimL family protein N-acetyltransferase